MQSVIDNIESYVGALVPVLVVLGVFYAYNRYESRRKNPRPNQLEEVLVAVEKMWPYLTTDTRATLIRREPAAFYTLSRAVAKRIVEREMKARVK
jgi:hypothetical protein